jgi:hypothetical protein
MAQIVYILTALTSLVCALLLARAYRRSPVPLLFWSALCFAAITLSNILLILDMMFISQVSLATARAAMSLFAMGLLLYGLIFKAN